MRYIVTMLALMLLPSAVAASELRYQPVNPSFGGNPFNSSHLQNLAETQKQFDAPLRTSTTDPLENFSQTVTSRLLSRLSSDIADAIFGEEAQDSGTFVVGDTTLNFNRVDDSVIINIVDAATGSETTVTLPSPNL